MNIVFAFFGAFFWLFLWMYIVSFMLYSGVEERFIQKARLGVLRGICVAILFLFFQYTPYLDTWIRRDWVLFPVIFFVFSLPFSWNLLKKQAFYPLFLWLGAFFFFSFFEPSKLGIVWWPFHEEIGKWYQTMTMKFPAVLVPFVSIGFAFVENFSYFSADMSWSEMIGRTVFSLPLHIFVLMISVGIFFIIPSRFLWIFCGLVVAIFLHTLYNWSLVHEYRFVTVFLMIAGYMYYGWSLENGWWRRQM